MKVGRLRSRLEAIGAAFGRRWLPTDPIELVRAIPGAEEREVAAFFASALAYGNVAQIRRSVAEAFRRMGGRPRAFVDRFEPRRARAAFEGFVHRFHRGGDLAALAGILARGIRRSGSIEGFFAEGHPPGARTVRDGLASFAARARALGEDLLPRDGAGVRFFFPSPAGGSACKRPCLFLRWVVRPDDGIDLGLWSRVSPAALVLPLDAHLWRLVRCLRLTERATPSWRAAEEATAALARLDASDPVRFDFALCRFGMLARCPRPRDARPCAACPGRGGSARRARSSNLSPLEAALLPASG